VPVKVIKLGKEFAFAKVHDQKSLFLNASAEIAGAFFLGKLLKALKPLDKLPDRSLYFPQ
jgi:hypothetical protein